MELLGLLQGVLLQVLEGEDVLDCLVEVNVVDLGGVVGYSVIGLEGLVFIIGQHDLLRVKDSSELLVDNMALSEGVVILEELTKTDAVLLDLGLQLEHQVSDLLLANENSLLADILIFLSLVQLFHLLFEGLEGCAIIDELKIPNLIVVSAVDRLNGAHFLIVHNEAQVIQGLSELLRGHLEVFVTIPILEEALGVKSVSCEPLTEGTKDLLDNDSLVS